MRHDRVSFFSSFFSTFHRRFSVFSVITDCVFSFPLLYLITGVGVVCCLACPPPLHINCYETFYYLATRWYFLMSKLRIFYIRFLSFSPYSFFLDIKLLHLKAVICF